MGCPLVLGADLVPELGVALEGALRPAVGFARVCPTESQHSQPSGHDFRTAFGPPVAVVAVFWFLHPALLSLADDLLGDPDETFGFSYEHHIGSLKPRFLRQLLSSNSPLSE